MAASAFEKLKQAVTGVVTTGESMVRTARPVVSKAAGSVASRLRGTGPAPVPGSAEPSAPATPSASPTPAEIAKNVAKQRPADAPPRQRSTPTADNTPGAKLPPRRRPQHSE